MGFGLVVIGYLTVFGTLPGSFIYYSWGIFIAVAGGFALFAGFYKLQEYNIYFKSMKYISAAYILILLAFAPFLIINHSDGFMQNFLFVSKVIRWLFLFVFHYFLLSGILSLSKEIGNIIIEKKAKRNIFFTYIYFFAFIFEFFFTEAAIVMLVSGFIYYFLILAITYRCYMKITFEGHDEAIDEKYELKNKNKKR